MGILGRWSRGRKARAGRVWDPVFIFMLVAMVLAVISSIALRTVVSGAGPSAARAADSSMDMEDLPKPGPMHVHPTTGK